MNKFERVAMSRELRRKAQLFRDQEYMADVVINALQARQNKIDPNTEDAYELQIGAMIELQLDLLGVQKSAYYGEAEMLERRATQVENQGTMTFMNSGEKPRGL